MTFGYLHNAKYLMPGSSTERHFVQEKTDFLNLLLNFNETFIFEIFQIDKSI